MRKKNGTIYNTYILHHLPLGEGFTFDPAELFEILCNLNPDNQGLSVQAEGNTQIRYRLRAIHKSGRHHCYHSCNSRPRTTTGWVGVGGI